ncbi:PTS sugar transporter subunit IIA [Lacticaseibacillus daqingensis]|uniref:PTS sugar transporter subunit IIA n=1 Tax=Lacticaseibacillus daqingensis TaxID=2486014 RepID=UPI000F779CFE|nr:PTS sugar transporter subunit IIA [Lacticaseibacillus daqingensis]
MQYILVSHGPLASGVLGSAEMILGPQDNVRTLSVVNDTTLEGMTAQIEAAYDESGQADTVILCDILGGTPSNASMRFIVGKSNVRILTGLNLPMVIEMFMAADKSLDELVEIGKQSYTKGLNSFKPEDLVQRESEEDFAL